MQSKRPGVMGLLRKLLPKSIGTIKLDFVLNRGRYKDGAGSVYPFDHCFMYRPGYLALAGYPKALSISPTEHWPEEINKSSGT